VTSLFIATASHDDVTDHWLDGKGGRLEESWIDLGLASARGARSYMRQFDIDIKLARVSDQMHLSKTQPKWM
jgi:hypothetical protein